MRTKILLAATLALTSLPNLYGQTWSGNALRFDGVDDTMQIGAAAVPAPWTAEFWVNRQDSPSHSSVLLADAGRALKLEQYPFTRRVGFTQFGVADYSFDYIAPIDSWVH